MNPAGSGTSSGWPRYGHITLPDGAGESYGDAIHQGTGVPFAVATEESWTARARASGIPQMSTGAGAHRGQQSETGRKLNAASGPDHGDEPVLEGLAQGVEGCAAEVGEVIEE